MRRGALCALLLALCLSLSACWVEAEEPDDDFWDGAEPAQQPQEEAHDFRPAAFALPYLAAQTLDPITCPDGMQQTVGSLLYEGLFTLDAQFMPRPVLCDYYTSDDAAKVYTFTLRGDATFSDGSVLTVSDVLATYRRAAASERYAARFANVEGMRVNRGTLIVTLARPDRAFPALLDIPVVKSGSEKNSVPLGTGPYYFASDEEGDCLLRREARAYGETGPLARIALAAVKDEASAVYLFSADGVHLFAADLTSDTPVASLGGVDITDAPTSTLLFLGFNLTRETTAGDALRRAMSEAFDRSAIVTTLLAGHADAAQFPISPASLLYPASLEIGYANLNYDAALLALGYDAAEPVELTLLVNAENPFKISVAEYLCRQFSAQGLGVLPRVLPWTEYLEALETADFDLYLGEVRLTADWDLEPLLGTEGTLNYGGFADEETDALLAALLAGQDAESSLALCRRLAELTPILPVAFKRGSLITAAGVADGMSPTAADPFYAFDAWSFRLSEP